MLKKVYESVLFVIKYMFGMGLFFAFFGGLYFLTTYVNLITGIGFLASEFVIASILLFVGHLFRHKFDEFFEYMFITRPEQKKIERLESEIANKNKETDKDA